MRNETIRHRPLLSIGITLLATSAFVTVEPARAVDTTTCPSPDAAVELFAGSPHIDPSACVELERQPELVSFERSTRPRAFPDRRNPSSVRMYRRVLVILRHLFGSLLYR